VTKALPFTQANIEKRIRAARRAGLFVTGITVDGTVLVSEEPPANIGSIRSSAFALDSGYDPRWDDVEA